MTPSRVEELVVDALAVPARYSGTGWVASEIGREIARLQSEGGWPGDLAVTLRCTRETRALLAPAFPAGVRIETPLAASRPQLRRLLAQLVVLPLRDGPGRLVVSTSELAAWHGRARRAVVIHDVRRLTAPSTARRSERWLYGTVVRRAARRAHALITVSRFSAREIARELARDAIVAHQHPRETPVHDAAARPGPVRCLVVSAVRSYKGLEQIAAALATAPDDMTVTWCGAVETLPPSTPDLSRALESGRLELAGWVDDDALEAEYVKADVVIGPSHYEGYGLGVANGIARGLPTIASDIPPHREIGAGAARYFAPGDAAALAALLTELRDPAVRAELAAASRVRAQELAALRPRWGEALLIAAGRPAG